MNRTDIEWADVSWNDFFIENHREIIDIQELWKERGQISIPVIQKHARRQGFRVLTKKGRYLYIVKIEDNECGSRLEFSNKLDELIQETNGGPLVREGRVIEGDEKLDDSKTVEQPMTEFVKLILQTCRESMSSLEWSNFKKELFQEEEGRSVE